jgi:hypothetical protein
MQLLHGLCCYDFVLDIPLSPATLGLDQDQNKSKHMQLVHALTMLGDRAQCLKTFYSHNLQIFVIS